MVLVPMKGSSSPCSKALNRQILPQEAVPANLKDKLAGLKYQHVFTADEAKLDELLYDYNQDPLPASVLKDSRPSYLSIDKIRFMQRSINFKSRAEKGGFEVLANAKKMKSGELQIQDLPPIHIWEDINGNIWTLNHRRLAAMHLSGVVKRVPVIWAKREEIESESSEDKFWPLNNGCTTEIINIKEQWGIRISVEGCN
jgi:hypothetical protein